ncbi:uncharacterized protein LOC126651970 [Myiozetetes cayanensis]|uniref:uncharacterized protein LOC126651970 n=1 Tax=Myiozetetes cayanensis TaxID=478635 RepID=UPI002160AD32|nr:uncharacterized protein LOC126651970 [Myiozetetes cayanensis]
MQSAHSWQTHRNAPKTPRPEVPPVPPHPKPTEGSPSTTPTLAKSSLSSPTSPTAPQAHRGVLQPLLPSPTPPPQPQKEVPELTSEHTAPSHGSPKPSQAQSGPQVSTSPAPHHRPSFPPQPFPTPQHPRLTEGSSNRSPVPPHAHRGIPEPIPHPTPSPPTPTEESPRPPKLTQGVSQPLKTHAPQPPPASQTHKVGPRASPLPVPAGGSREPSGRWDEAARALGSLLPPTLPSLRPRRAISNRNGRPGPPMSERRSGRARQSEQAPTGEEGAERGRPDAWPLSPRAERPRAGQGGHCRAEGG